MSSTAVEDEAILEELFAEMKQAGFKGPEVTQQEEEPCRWDTCSLIFPNVDLLCQHVIESHLDTVPSTLDKSELNCLWNGCTKTSNFGSHNAFQTHVKIHTGQKPYFCSSPTCYKQFPKLDQMVKHMRITHGLEASNYQHGMELIKEGWQKDLEKLEHKSHDDINDSEMLELVLEQCKTQSEVELWSKYNTLINAYTELRMKGLESNELDSQIDKIFWMYQYNPPNEMTKGVIEDAKMALETQFSRIYQIKQQLPPNTELSVGSLDIDQIPRYNLNETFQSLLQYKNKLDQLGTIFDSKLINLIKDVKLNQSKVDELIEFNRNLH